MTDDPVTCKQCREPIDGGAHFVMYGQFDADKQGFDPTGGLPQKFFCSPCYRNHFTRDIAAHWEVDNSDQLWAVLEASDGELVADMTALFVGGGLMVRVPGPLAIEAVVPERFHAGHTDDGTPILGHRWKRSDLGVDEFANTVDANLAGYTDTDEPRPRPIKIKPRDETPFADDYDLDNRDLAEFDANTNE